MDIPPGPGSALPSSSSSSRGSSSRNRSTSSRSNRFEKTLEVTNVPEGSPLPPDLVQNAVNARPTTFDAKEEEKRPSIKSLSKKKIRRSSRRTSKSKTRKTRLNHDDYVDDDDDDGSVFSISSLGSMTSSVSAGSRSTARTSQSDIPTATRAPYPKKERNDFLNDIDDLSKEYDASTKSSSQLTIIRGNVARIKSSTLESVPLEETLVPPSGVDENGAASPSSRDREEKSQHSRGSTGSGRRAAISHGKPPEDLNIDAADQYMFSERTPKSYSMAMNDWVMRQMGDNDPTLKKGSPASTSNLPGGKPRLGDGWDSDQEDDRSRHVRDVFARIEETGITPPASSSDGGSNSSPRVFDSLRTTWTSARNSIIGVKQDYSPEERVAMTTNIAPAHYSNNQALAVVCENEFPAGDVRTPPRRNVFRQMFGRSNNASSATMAYLRDNVEQGSTQTDRTAPSTGNDATCASNPDRPFGVFRPFYGEDSFLSRYPRCDCWSNQRRLAIVLLGSILATIVALSAYLILQYNAEDSNGSSWEVQYGPRSEPPRPKPSPPPDFVGGEDPNAVTAPWNLENLKLLLGEVTPSYELEDPDTPQGQAMAWLARDLLEDAESYLSEHRVMQRYVLATLYYSTTQDDKGWFVKEDWLSSKHECTWFGVMCGNDGSGATDAMRDETDLTHEVTLINLSSNDLHGPIPPEIAKLRNLAQLHLYDNFLSGTIPKSISELSQLHTLFLDYNYLEGEIPAEMNDLTNLVNLDLSNNSLEGTIPNLERLINLVHLRLDNNNLSGEFPESLDRLVNVEVLTMGNNGIRGTLPVALEEHQKLVILHLHENRLEGSIPECKSPVLEEIHLDNNEFTGSIPLIVEAKRTPSLRELRLERNNLSGSIPLHLSEMYLLETLWLDENKLTGPIPHEIGRLERLKSLRLLQNDLTGTVPSPVCALRSYSLSTFQATCDGSNPSLTCSCCTRCTY